MEMEQDRRRHKRLPIELNLEINHMFRQGNEVVDHMDAKIEVINISKSGVGFISEAVLPLDFFFNARISLSKDEFIFTVVRIVRKNKKIDDTYEYGAEFVGLDSVLADKIDLYERALHSKTVS